jgi:hypothetical protein
MRILLLAAALSAFIAAPALACGPAGTDRGAGIPPLAAGIDALLPQAKLTADQIAKVNALRSEIRDLAAAGKEETARQAEEQAMKMLGYKKAWLACGPGTFLWMKG